MKWNMFFIILFFCVFNGCKPDEPIEPQPPKVEDTSSNLVENKYFDLIFYKRMAENSFCRTTAVTPYNVIYAIQPRRATGSNDHFIALNKETGDTIWVLPNQGATSNYKYHGDYLFFNKRDRLAALDIKTGQLLWEFSGGNIGDGKLCDYTFGNNRIFAFFNFGRRMNLNDSMYLFSIDPMSGVGIPKNVIYTVDRQGFQPYIQGVLYWQHPDGRDILFCQSSSWNWDVKVNQGRGDYFALDVNNKNYYWDLGFHFFDTADINTRSPGSIPLASDNNIYISSGWDKKAGLDLLNKKVLWESRIPEAYATGQYFETPGLYHNQKLYFGVGNFRSFNVVNALDGSFVAGNKNLGTDFYASPIRYFNNGIWCTTTDGFFKLDEQANIIAQVPNHETVGGYLGSFQMGMDIDPETGYIDTTRGYAYVCLKEKK